MTVAPSRRELLSWLPAAFALASCAKPDETPKPAPLVFLTDAEAAQLAAWADEVFPPDGSSLGAVRYVDRLTTDTDVFFSSLGTAVELDRVSRAAWELRTTALKQQLRTVLANQDVPLGSLPFEDREFICELVTQAAFSRPEYGGNPDRAGWARIGSLGPDAGFVTWDGEKNVERADAPVSTPEPGVDAFPMDRSTRDLLTEVARATGGRSAS
jgi:hypothetical protein